jgi:hypothetical protein
MVFQLGWAYPAASFECELMQETGLSRAWRVAAKRERWFEMGFEIRTMDEWGEQMVEVTEDESEW